MTLYVNVCMYVCMYALQEVVSAMEKQYQHILTLLKEKEAILMRDKAVTEREYRVRNVIEN